MSDSTLRSVSILHNVAEGGFRSEEAHGPLTRRVHVGARLPLPLWRQEGDGHTRINLLVLYHLLKASGFGICIDGQAVAYFH